MRLILKMILRNSYRVIIASGYATDPAYVSKAVKIWDKYDTIKNFNTETPELIGKQLLMILLGKHEHTKVTKICMGLKFSKWNRLFHLVCKALSDLWEQLAHLIE